MHFRYEVLELSIALLDNGGGNLECDLILLELLKCYPPKTFTNFLFLLLKRDHALIQCVIYMLRLFL